MSTAGMMVLSVYTVLIVGLVVAGFRTNWKKWIQRTLAYSLIPAGVGLVFAVGLQLSGSDGEKIEKATAEAGTDPNATREALRQLATALNTADKKGDVALAQKVMLSVIPVLAKLNDQPLSRQYGTPLYNCKLAAVHLTDAAAAVAAGSRWLTEDRFQAAAADCRV